MGMFQWNTWKKFVKYMVESAKGKKIGISSRKVGKYYDETGKSKKIYGDSESV